MPAVKVSGRAQTDVLDLWDYIAERDPDAADRMIDRIMETALTYAQYPSMGRLKENLGPSIRSFPVAPYLIFYHPIATGILIDRILHASRDIDTELPE